MLGYRVPAPDDAMLISGGKHGKSGTPFRVVVGRGAFVLPGFRKARYLTLRMQESSVREPCVTQQGLSVRVEAVVAFKVGNDDESIVNAGQRFLSDQTQMPNLTGQIFAGHLRAIVGAMTLEQIITDRQALASQVLDASKIEMGKLGLTVDSFQIQNVDDLGSGYIDAMSAPHRAKIAQQAKIAQALADQAAAEQQQASARQQIEYQRQTAVAQADADQQTAVAQAQAAQQTETAKANADASVAQTQAKNTQTVQLAQVEAQRAAQVAGAQAKAQIDQEQATAGQAGPLAQAKAQVGVLQAQAEAARKQTELRAQQLQAEVIKPAEADAQKVTINAKAQAEAQTTLAAAAASNNRIALDQMLIERLPEIVQAAAAALSGANLTVVNGAEGTSQMITSAVTQGLAILDTLKGSLGRPQDSPNGEKPAQLAGH